MEPDKNAGLRETRKHHVRIVLQSGERWYLNQLGSETARRSRITSAAAAKLGRGSVHDKRMHLRDVNGMEVSITVDVVDTTGELLEGEDSLLGSPKPHMVLTPGDERRIQGMMLIGSGLALKNPPKKTHPKKPKKTHLKKPNKSGFFGFF